MDSGDRGTEEQSRGDFWLPPIWVPVAAYAALLGLGILLDELGWSLGWGPLDDPRMEFQPLGWILSLDSIALFLAAFMLHKRRELVVPLIALGLARTVIAFDGSLSAPFENELWWTSSVPSVVTPAIAGLVFAGWSRLAPEPPEKHFRASVNEPLWLPSARGAFAFLVSVLIVAVSPILFDVFAYAEHPWRMIPFEVVNAVVGPALFVSVFVIGSPRALLVAFAASAIVYLVVLLQHAIDDVVCAKIGGESTSCAVQNFWFALHQSLPAMLTIAAAALLASRWSRLGQNLKPVAAPAT